jgi:hypothetical protein
MGRKTPAKRLPIMKACTCALFTSSYAYAECIQVPACCCPSVPVCILVGWVGTDMWCMLHPMGNAVDRNSGAVLVLLGLLPPVMLKARKPAHSYMVKGKLAVAPLPASIFHKVTCIPPSAAAVLGQDQEHSLLAV